MITSFPSIDWIQKNLKIILIGSVITIAVINLNNKLWIILPNEELIVVFCFFSFIYFCSIYLAPSIEESLNERSSTIAKELQHIVNLNKSLLEQSISTYSKQLKLAQTISRLSAFSINFLTELKKKSKYSLNQILLNQMKSKIYGLLGITSNFKSNLQVKIVDSIRSGVSLKLLRLKIKKNTSLPFALAQFKNLNIK